MSEHIPEHRLALYAGRDVSEKEAAAIDTHMRDCAGCRDALDRFENLRDLLACSYPEPEPSDLREVRKRVTRETERGVGGNFWPWLLAATAAAALFFVSLLGIRQRHPPISAPVPAVQFTALPVMPAQPVMEIPALQNIARRALPKREAAIRSVALITRANEPPLIRMTTADRNVVILWESNNEEENE